MDCVRVTSRAWVWSVAGATSSVGVPAAPVVSPGPPSVPWPVAHDGAGGGAVGSGGNGIRNSSVHWEPSQ